MSNTDYFEPGDVFDSREVLERIEFLANDDDLTPEEEYELDELRAFQSEAVDYVSDWEYGETFISDDYFENYARELADDIGLIDSNASWPLNYIDWEAAADELKTDYNSFEFRGTTYWAR